MILPPSLRTLSKIAPKSPKQYSLPHLAHYVKVVLQIVDGGERGEQHFAGLEQVAEVGARVGAAGDALAVGVERAGIAAIAGLLNNHAAD